MAWQFIEAFHCPSTDHSDVMSRDIGSLPVDQSSPPPQACILTYIHQCDLALLTGQTGDPDESKVTAASTIIIAVLLAAGQPSISLYWLTCLLPACLPVVGGLGHSTAMDLAGRRIASRNSYADLMWYPMVACTSKPKARGRTRAEIIK